MSTTATIQNELLTNLTNSTGQNNAATIQRLYDAFGQGDVDTIVSLCADNVDWDNSRVASSICPWNGNFSGTTRLPGFFKVLREQLQFREFTPHQFVASGAHVVVTLTIKSTLTKNGQPLENDVVHIWAFNDAGKVSSYRHYNDTAQELLAWNA